MDCSTIFLCIGSIITSCFCPENNSVEYNYCPKAISRAQKDSSKAIDLVCHALQKHNPAMTSLSARYHATVLCNGARKNNLSALYERRLCGTGKLIESLHWANPKICSLVETIIPHESESIFDTDRKWNTRILRARAQTYPAELPRSAVSDSDEDSDYDRV